VTNPKQFLTPYAYTKGKPLTIPFDTITVNSRRSGALKRKHPAKFFKEKATTVLAMR
jgi:hypothetical protein